MLEITAPTDTNLNSGGKICGLKSFLGVFGEGRAEQAPRAPSPLHSPQLGLEAISGQQVSKNWS